MKTTILLAAALTSTSMAAVAAGVVFKTPVTYTEPVTYAAGVTYLAPVTYAAATTTLEPVLLERVIVTPKRVYAEHEWQAHIATRGATARLWPVHSTRRLDLGGHNWLRSLLILQ